MLPGSVEERLDFLPQKPILLVFGGECLLS
jgi:hypothetical protein